jgi:cytochrome P450
VLWREAEGNGGEVDGIFIPPGCVVGTGIYSLHHNASYYPEPFLYRPERWIDDSNEALRTARAAAVGFGVGPRICIGKELALQETSLAIAAALWRMEFSRVAGEKGRIGEGRKGGVWGRQRPDEFQLVDHLTGSKEGPFLNFSPRLSQT